VKIPKRNFIQNIIHLIGLYGFYIKLYFKTLVEYRIGTWVAIIAGLIAQVSGLAFIGIVFQKIPQLGGWTFYELVFMFSFAGLGRGLNQVFFNVPYGLTRFIRRGTLDILMIRPVGPLFQAIGVTQEINGMGNVITSFIILCYAAANLGIEWTFGKVLYTLIAIISSMFIILAVLFSIMVCTFWVQEIRSVIYPVAWLYDFSKYPLDIFGPVLRGILTFVIPYSIGSYYPSVYILRPATFDWALWVVPLSAIVLMTLAYRFWLFGLEHYTSSN
jgi:ABC-2 type transport system permease protein